MAYDYDPLNLGDPNHPLARLGADLAQVQQRDMARRRSLADQLRGYPAQQMPQQQTRLASMLGQPAQQPNPMGQMSGAINSLFGLQQKMGSGASVSAPMPLGDPNKPGPAADPGWFRSTWQGLFGNGAAKG